MTGIKITLFDDAKGRKADEIKPWGHETRVVDGERISGISIPITAKEATLGNVEEEQTDSDEWSTNKEKGVEQMSEDEHKSKNTSWKTENGPEYAKHTFQSYYPLWNDSHDVPKKRGYLRIVWLVVLFTVCLLVSAVVLLSNTSPELFAELITRERLLVGGIYIVAAGIWLYRTKRHE